MLHRTRYRSLGEQSVITKGALLEEILFLFLRTIAGAVAWVLVDFLIHTVFYHIGWLVCKTFTLGKYPSKTPCESGLGKSYLDPKNLVPVIGCLSMIISILIANII